MKLARIHSAYAYDGPVVRISDWAETFRRHTVGDLDHPLEARGGLQHRLMWGVVKSLINGVAPGSPPAPNMFGAKITATVTRPGTEGTIHLAPEAIGQEDLVQFSPSERGPKATGPSELGLVSLARYQGVADPSNPDVLGRIQMTPAATRFEGLGYHSLLYAIHAAPDVAGYMEPTHHRPPVV